MFRQEDEPRLLYDYKHVRELRDASYWGGVFSGATGMLITLAFVSYIIFFS